MATFAHVGNGVNIVAIKNNKINIVVVIIPHKIVEDAEIVFVFISIILNEVNNNCKNHATISSTNLLIISNKPLTVKKS